MMNSIQRYLSLQNSLFDTGKPQFFSVSGGQDSAVMLCLLIHHIRHYQLTACISHINHICQIENTYWELQSYKISRVYILPIISSLFFVSTQSELRASDLRYDLWIRQCFYYRAQSLNLAHSQSDFLEQRFVNFLRHQNVESRCNKNDEIKTNDLVASWPKINRQVLLSCKKRKVYYIPKRQWIKISSSTRTLKINRPLFQMTRKQIQEMLNSSLVPYQIDFTNYNYTTLHNFCRHQLIPLTRLHVQKDFSAKPFFLKKDILATQISNASIVITKTRKSLVLYFVTRTQFCVLASKLQPLYGIGLIRKDVGIWQEAIFKNDLTVVQVTYPQIVVGQQFMILRF